MGVLFNSTTVTFATISDADWIASATIIFAMFSKCDNEWSGHMYSLSQLIVSYFTVLLTVLSDRTTGRVSSLRESDE